MKQNLTRLMPLGCALGIAVLAGCAGSSSNQAAIPGAQGLTQPAAIHVVAPARITPDTPCGTPVTEPIHRLGGSIFLPACDTLTSTIGYPKNNAPAGTTTTLTSYDADPGGGTGVPSSGTVIAWVKSHGNGSGSITFNNPPPLKTGKLSGAPLELPGGHDYQLYVYAFGAQQGSALDLGQPTCVGPPTNKCTLGPFPSPLTGQTVPQGIDLFFELDQM